MLTKSDKKYLEERYLSKSEFYEKFDMLIGEIRAFHEEMAALTFRSREHTDQLENHNTRLTTIEEKISF